MVGPCQHLSCQNCVNDKIFKDGRHSQCRECDADISRKEVKKSDLMLRIINDLKNLTNSN